MGLRLGRLALYALVAAVAGTCLDRIHTYFGVLRYAHPCFDGEACMVPVVMAGAGVALVVTHALYRRLFGQGPGGELRAVVIGSVDFALAYLASGLFQATPRLLLAGYAVVVALRLGSHPLPARAALTATAMAVGIAAELVLTHVGFFTYLHPDLFGLPYWIGGLYWFAGLAGAAAESRWPITAR